MRAPLSIALVTGLCGLSFVLGRVSVGSSAPTSLGETVSQKHLETLEAVDLVVSHAPDALHEIEHGYAIPADGSGHLQSPIDIRTTDLSHARHEVSLEDQVSHAEVRNLGHTVQLDVDPGAALRFDGEQYELLQFHFHTPSEHLVDGMTYPLEMHLVHRRVGDDPKAERPDLLVVGLLFKEGSSHPFLERFLDMVPDGKDHATRADCDGLDFRDLFGERTDGFFHYRGSLTTPPFTECVTWLVVVEPQMATPEQIDRLHRVEGNNARHVQALHGRTVELCGTR